MASDLFPVHRSDAYHLPKSPKGGAFLAGNRLADAVMQAFGSYFSATAANEQDSQSNNGRAPTHGTIVPPAGEINP